MSAHTPGPWRADVDEKIGDWQVISFNGRTVVADRPSDHRATGGIADARLIAAAPDLLAEHEKDLAPLEMIEAWLIRAGYPPNNPAMEALGAMMKAKRAAIAKATGPTAEALLAELKSELKKKGAR